MKRLFLMLLATVSLIACDKGDETPKPIELTGDTQTSQTIYADETQKSEGIKFKATEPWTATVSEVASKANDEKMWFRLSAYEGKAGDITLGFEIDANDTGKDRKAEIRITCGGTTITIIVEQKATIKPEDPDKPKPDIRYVKKITSKGVSSSLGGYSFESTMDIKYDNQMRIEKMKNVNSETLNGVTELETSNAYLTHKDNTISMKIRGAEQEIDQMSFDIVLNPNGTVKQIVLLEKNTSEVGVKSAMFALPTHSAVSKNAAVGEFKTTMNYTYDPQGYVTKVAQRQDYNGELDRLGDYFISWSNGNLSRVDVELSGSSGSKAYDEYSYSTIENKPCNLDVSRYAADGEWTNAALSVASVLGLTGKPCKYLPSLLKSSYKSSSISSCKFTYTIDSEGYITSVTKESTDNSAYSNTITIEYVK